MDRGREKAISAAQAAARKKALDVTVLDVKGIFPAADYFVICSGRNANHLAAIAREVEDEIRKSRDGYFKREGIPESGWVLLDCGDVVVHIFSQEARAFYDLESLWGDSRVIFQSF